MSPLSAKARAIVGAGRAGLQPTPGTRERVEALLDARLAAGATGSTAGGSVSAGVKLWQVGLTAALVGGAATFAALYFRAEVSTSPVSAAKAPVMQASVTAPPLPAQPTRGELPEPIASAPSEPAATTPRSPTDQLALEVALLSRGTSALRAGRAAEALKVLDEHKRQFPNGVLAVDRRAARAQALCTLKREAEGRAELLRLDPQSPAAERTRRVCDAVAAKRERP